MTVTKLDVFIATVNNISCNTITREEHNDLKQRVDKNVICTEFTDLKQQVNRLYSWLWGLVAAVVILSAGMVITHLTDATRITQPGTYTSSQSMYQPNPTIKK